MRLSVKVKVRASRSRILRAEGLSLEVSLAAPPVDGAANTELIQLLSDVLTVPKSALSLVVGETSRQKVVEVAAISVEEVTSRLTRAVK